MNQSTDNSEKPLADRRFFLGLSRPPLLSATEWLFQTDPPSAGMMTWDLSDRIIVVPTGRSQVRLKQLLVQKSAEVNLSLIPPKITTLGEFPELLYSAEKKLASELVQQIAWARALEELRPEEFRQLTGSSNNARPDDWQPFAAMIAKLHSRLSTDIWSFRSVAREVANTKGFLKEELARWEVLQTAQKGYYKILDEVNLWDRQAARNYAAGGLLKANEVRCHTTKKIVMLATADLTRSVSEMLRQIVYKNPEQVDILVAAPENMADRFDHYGSLITASWLDVTVKIPDSKIRIADQPADQAFVAGYFLCGLENVSTDEVTLGAPDESIVPQLERTLNSLELPHRSLAGKRLQETAPVKLLAACGEYLRDFSFDALSALVRHPDLFKWLNARVESNSWLTDLAIFQNSNLPDLLELNQTRPFGDPDKIIKEFDPKDASSKRRAERNAASTDVLNHIYQLINGLLGELVAGEKGIGDWAALWRKLLVEIYGDRELDRTVFIDRQTLMACTTIFQALEEQEDVPPSLQARLTAIEALDWALKAASERRVLSPEQADAVEIAGWLDLALDDAPVMVVTGMNDEFVPTSERGHPFLPNELCKQLNILDNDRRFARDVYALMLITSVRQNYLLVTGRRNDSGEPLKPSRLLFADGPLVAAKRAKAFFDYKGKDETQFWLASPENAPRSQQLAIPEPHLTKPVTQLTVTKFRDYLKCPYRFYLNHVLNLESVVDDWRELDAGKFGDLIHDCLERFAKSDLVNSRKPKLIFSFLNDQLNDYVERRLTGKRFPAVEIQIKQIRLRFERFAEIQAERRSLGWQIVSTEELLVHEFMVDGKPFQIRGKIDRIDQHELTGQVAVWDYKSSDKGEGPVNVHYAPKKGEWKDLQLPLYRYLLKEVEILRDANLSNIITGYVLLPKRLEEIRFEATDWTESEYEEAAEVARNVVRKLRESIFWPPNPKPPLYSDDFASICQDNVFEQFEIPNGNGKRAEEVVL